MPRLQHKIGNCIYIIGYSNMPNMFKIGKTKNMNTRLKSYVTCNPHDTKILHIQYIEQMTLAENIIKTTLKPYHHCGEGGKEWYKCHDIDIIKEEIKAISNFLNYRIDTHKVEDLLLTNYELDQIDQIDQIDILIREGQLVLCICDDLFHPDNYNQKLCKNCISNPLHI